MRLRSRVRILITLAVLLIFTASCSWGLPNRQPTVTPVPTKTLRPTFTHTPPRAAEVMPTATPGQPVIAVTEAPPSITEPAPEPPTPEPPSPKPQRASFTVANALVNVRSGPGTSYAQIGQVRQGQSYEITGRNPAGDWWQFDFNGQPGWITDSLVQANATEGVTVAADIPRPPTARPRPAAPQPAPQPTNPPAPQTKYRAADLTERINTGDRITVFCQLNPDFGTGKGLPGVIRITRGGASAAPDHEFGTILNWANTGMSKENQFIYNENCKVELPLAAGTYVAYIVENGAPVSDPISFEVRGDIREFVLKWVLR